MNLHATFEAASIVVDGLEASVVDVGSGPPVVLWHSGEYGACTAASWLELIPVLVGAGYRVVAPDWLGFGGSAKIVDFADPAGRRLRHMRAVLRRLGVESAAYIGTSMGATALVKAIAADPPLPAAVAVVTSGGGRVIDNEARRAIQHYDLTLEGMRRLLSTMLHGKNLVEDEEYVRWRHQLSLVPGAWACASAARLRPPTAAGATPPRAAFGNPDTVPYERIGCPVLVVAGANDPLREPGFANAIAARIPDARVAVYEECGHLPNIEYPERYASDVIAFLDRHYPAAGS